MIFEEAKRIGSPTVGEEVAQSLATRTRVKTKVKSSLSQVPVSSSIRDSLGSPNFVPQSPLGPSRRSRSKQKTIGDSVERERRARPLSFFSHSCCSSLLLLLQCFIFKLISDYFPCSPSVSRTLMCMKYIQKSTHISTYLSLLLCYFVTDYIISLCCR